MVEHKGNSGPPAPPVNKGSGNKGRTSHLDVLLGEHVHSLRVARRMTQTELAQRIGISFQQVQKYERGANRISASTLILIADVFGISPVEILLAANVGSPQSIPAHLPIDVREIELLKGFRGITSAAQQAAILDLVGEVALNAQKLPQRARAD